MFHINIATTNCHTLAPGIAKHRPQGTWQGWITTTVPEAKATQMGNAKAPHSDNYLSWRIGRWDEASPSCHWGLLLHPPPDHHPETEDNVTCRGNHLNKREKAGRVSTSRHDFHQTRKDTVPRPMSGPLTSSFMLIFQTLDSSPTQWEISKLTCKAEESHERIPSKDTMKHVTHGSNLGFIIFLLITYSRQDMATFQVFNILYI